MNSVRYARALILLGLLAGLVAAVGGAAAEPEDQAANAGWVEIGVGSASGGGISKTSGISTNPALAIGPDGAPIIAWEALSNGNFEIYVRRWTGAAWVEIGAGSASGGGISKNSGGSNSPSLAIGPDGTPVVTWYDDSSGNREIYVRRWNGSSWVEIGNSSASGGGISDNSGSSYRPSVDIGPDGMPVVAWYDDSSGNEEIYVRHWNGSSWVEMGNSSASGGGISDNSNSSYLPSIAIGPNGMPIVAWEDVVSTGNQEIYIRRWNGSAWTETGAGSASGGGISKTSGSSNVPSLAIGPDGAPVVAWMDNTTVNREIYVRRWNGSAWTEIGAGSASGGGISNSSGGSGAAEPSLTIGLDGMPIIAWFNHYQYNFKIYIRRWNGSAWVEMDAGSASGGGISDTGGATTPSLATGPGGAPIVAWKDDSSGYREIYVRRYSPICYTLSRTHTGQGSNPTASPPNSTGCAAGQYTAGQAISLTAAPTAGHRVKNWSGTANNASLAATNSLTMPAASHTVSVAYEPILGMAVRAFTPAIANVPQTCWPGPNEAEPNNTAKEANGPICPGAVIRGMQLHLYYGTIGGSPSYLDTEDSDGLQAALRGAQPGRYYIAIYTETPNQAETRLYRLQVSVP
jgi:hypothetical protein